MDRLHRRRDFKTTKMRQVGVLVLALGCCVCLFQVEATEDTGTASQCSGSCDISCLIQMPQKVATIGEKMKQLESRLQESEKVIKELRGQIEVLAGAPRVAFSAALRSSGRGNIGSFIVDTPLKYERVFSNAGSSYNPSTGAFTAVVKGMYYFRFTMFSSMNPPNSVVCLEKNGEQLTCIWDISVSDINDSGSGAVVIPLEVGDSVYVELKANRLVYDDGGNYNTFSGFLLFTL